MENLTITNYMAELNEQEVLQLIANNEEVSSFIDCTNLPEFMEFNKSGWRLKFIKSFAFGNNVLNNKLSLPIRGQFRDDKEYFITLYKFTGMNISVSKEDASILYEKGGFFEIFSILGKLCNFLGNLFNQIYKAFDDYEKSINSDTSGDKVDGGQLDKVTHEDKKNEVELSNVKYNPRSPHENLPVKKSTILNDSKTENEDGTVGMGLYFQTKDGKMIQTLSNLKLHDQMYFKNLKDVTSGMKLPSGVEFFRIKWIPKKHENIEAGLIHGIFAIYESE